MSIQEISLSEIDFLVDSFNSFEDYYAVLGECRASRSPQFGYDYARALVPRLEQNNGKIYGMFLEKKVVGFIIGIMQNQTLDEQVAEGPIKYGKILELFVEPVFRRRKVGQMLLKKMEEFFKDQNCGEALLEIHPDNAEAGKFYTALGFGKKNVILSKSIV